METIPQVSVAAVNDVPPTSTVGRGQPSEPKSSAAASDMQEHTSTSGGSPGQSEPIMELSGTGTATAEPEEGTWCVELLVGQEAVLDDDSGDQKVVLLEELSDDVQEQFQDDVKHTEEDEFELLTAALVPLPAVIEQEPDAPPPKYPRFSSRHFVRPRPDDEWETESEAEFTDSSELVNSSSSDEDDEPPKKQGRVDPEAQKSAAQRAKTREEEEEEKKRTEEDALYLRFRIATLGEERANAGLGQGESSSDSENDTAGGTH